VRGSADAPPHQGEQCVRREGLRKEAISQDLGGQLRQSRVVGRHVRDRHGRQQRSRLKRAVTVPSVLSTSGRLGARFSATRLFLSTRLPRPGNPDDCRKMPPPSWVAELRATVLFVSVAVPPLEMPPPTVAELPATVRLVTLRVPPLEMLPLKSAELPETVLLASVTLANRGPAVILRRHGQSAEPPPAVPR
jgi:hypothetical protein